jgi:uncharacterized membrane protein YeaQ/YmgE (transglycosylase-associated protein family)
MLGLIVSLLIIGLIAGALARLVVPGRQDMSILMTIVLGVIGSFVGGLALAVAAAVGPPVRPRQPDFSATAVCPTNRPGRIRHPRSLFLRSWAW